MTICIPEPPGCPNLPMLLPNWRSMVNKRRLAVPATGSFTLKKSHSKLKGIFRKIEPKKMERGFDTLHYALMTFEQTPHQPTPHQRLAILRQLGKETEIFDDAELQCHQKLQNLYNSTRESKHFQREIVRGVESSVSTTKKQLEIVRKLAENCCKFANENQEAGSSFSRAVMQFGTAHNSIEDEKETMLGIFIDQVSNPLRASITGAPLEDARHLTRRCERLRQEVEAQAAEVIKRQSRSRDASAESVSKLKNAEARLTEHRASMVVLQREATTAMLSVEDQQQQLTFQKLLTMVGAERSYHVCALDILDELHTKMILEMQSSESSWKPETFHSDVNAPPAHKDTTLSGSDDQATENKDDKYFMAKVKHPFDAQTDGELSLAVDEYVAVYQVAPSGWSEGKCMGKTGWFPSAYVEREDKALVSNILEPINSP